MNKYTYPYTNSYGGTTYRYTNPHSDINKYTNSNTNK
jgi:hypothetical protein